MRRRARLLLASAACAAALLGCAPAQAQTIPAAAQHYRRDLIRAAHNQ